MGLKFMNELDYNSITNHLANKEVVLFLGPLFGIDKECTKLNSSFRKTLQETFVLDDEFENLFILKQSKEKIDPGDLLNLRDQFDTFYESQSPHPVYETIAKLKFTAIFNCSQDLFLYKAFDNDDSRVDFSHFSAKKTDSAHPVAPLNGETIIDGGATAEKGETRPIVFNVYGNYKDPQSLITDYESFYNFLMSLISANEEIPQKLKNALKKADIFIFLGFNLARWFIPLLIRKLYKLAENEKVSSYATLEDTLQQLTIPGLEQMDSKELVEAIKSLNVDDNDRVSCFLDKYPARFRVTADSNVEFIERIAKGKGVLKPVIDPAIIEQKRSELQIDKDRLIGIHVQGDTLMTLEELEKYFKDKHEEEKIIAVQNLEQRHNQVTRDFLDKLVTTEQKDIEIRKVVELTGRLINSISV